MTTPNAGLEGLVESWRSRSGHYHANAQACTNLASREWNSGNADRLADCADELEELLKATPLPGAEGDARDAERYRELRERVCIRSTEMASGNRRDCFEFEVGASVVGLPCRAREGFVSPEKFDLRKAQVDTAIDTALASRRELGGVSGEGK